MADTGRLDELKRKFDENPRRYFAPLANEYRKNGEFDRAIELCRAYLPHQPGHMSGYIVYGQSLFDAGRGHEAAEIFQQALQLDPENVIALRHLGDIARQDGNKALAMQWYGRVLELDPKNEEITAYITGLATPGTPLRAPEGPERPVPPTIRPEPEHVDDAVALADLMDEPDTPRPAFEATGWSGVSSAQQAREMPDTSARDDSAGAHTPNAAEQMFDIVASGESAIEPSITEFLNDRSRSTFEFELGPVDPADPVNADVSGKTDQPEHESSADPFGPGWAQPSPAQPLYELSSPEDVLPPLLEPEAIANLQEMERHLHADMGTEPGVSPDVLPDLPASIVEPASLLDNHADAGALSDAFESMTPWDPSIPPATSESFADPHLPAPEHASDSTHAYDFAPELESAHKPESVSASDTTHDANAAQSGGAEPVEYYGERYARAPGAEHSPSASEPEYEREPEPEEPLDIGTPFITETMAMLYLQQGFTAEALDVYRKLAATRDEPRLHDKVRELEARLATGTPSSDDAPRTAAETSHIIDITPSDTLPAPAGESVRAFFVRIGARRPDMRDVVHAAASGDAIAAQTPSATGLGSLFNSAQVDDRDVRAAESLAGAFSAPR